MESATRFRGIIIRLIYESDKMQTSQDIAQKEFEKYIRKKDTTSKKISQKSVEKQNEEVKTNEKNKASNKYPTLDNLTKEFDQKLKIESKSQEKVLYCEIDPPSSVGQGKSLLQLFVSLEELSDDGLFIEINNKTNLFIKDYSNFNFGFEIYDEKLKNLVYKRPINHEINYDVDDNQKIFKWINYDISSGKMTVYGCRMNESSIPKFRFVFARCMIEHKRQINLSENSPLSRLLQDKDIFLRLKKINSILASIKVDEKKQEQILIDTISQSDSELWLKERRLRLTASNFGLICKSRSEKKLAENMVQPRDPHLNFAPPLKWGHDKEDLARKQYEQETGNKVILSGLHIDLNHNWIAASPDGILDDGEGIIEIKCPYSARFEVDFEKSIQKISCLRSVDFNYTLDKNHNYYYQIQGLLNLLDKKYCDFIVWTPNFMKIFKIERDTVFWNEAFIKLKYFYFNFYLIELADFHEKAKPLIEYESMRYVKEGENSSDEEVKKESFDDIFKKADKDTDPVTYMGGSIEKNKDLHKRYQNYDDIVFEDAHVSFKDDQKIINNYQAQAKVLDRTFISKGNVVSVYMADEDNNSIEIKQIVSLPPVQKLNNADKVTPKKMMLHESDAKILMLDEKDNRSIYYMDIEKGKVIRELTADIANTIKDIAPISKNAEFTTNPMFIGLNDKNIFKLDPRSKDPTAAAISSKIYAKTNGFTCISTTGTDECFATGSAVGEVRLYNQVGKNAKNLYPGLGDAIIGMDSTKDGKWLLATTKTYIVLIPTFASGKDGYNQALGADKYIPYRLGLSTEDQKRLQLNEFSFTIAKFNDSKDQDEKFIVSSAGKYLITWSMKNITSGKAIKYQIKPLSDNVCYNEFRFDREDSIILTLPHEVILQKAKNI